MDTAFAQTARALSGGKLFAFSEHQSKVPAAWSKTINDEGTSVEPWLAWSARWAGKQADSQTSTLTGHTVTEAAQAVTWYGPNDTDNPRNWNSSYKAAIAAIIW